MDVKLKREWIKALRSGKYNQGRDALRRDGAYCCLGVLCEIGGGRVTSEMTFPSASFCKRVGLSDGLAATLASMNDGISHYAGNPQSFSQIADWLDSQP